MNRDDFRLRAEFRRALKEARLADGERLLVAVSGGCDSVALLRLLADEAPRRAWSLFVGHADHALRAGSSVDAAFVRGVADGLGLPCRVARAAPGALEAPRRSPEEAARRFRRRALRRMAARVDAGRIVLGHTLDDQAETVLLHLLRGAGLRGLGGMAPARGPWLRPLLAIRRNDLRAWAERRGLAWREDPTNAEERFLRNRIRRRLLPLLEAEFQPGAARVLARAAENLRPLRGRLAREAAGAWNRTVREDDGGTIRLERLELAAYPEDIVDEVLSRAYRRLRGTARDLKRSHLAPLSRMIRGGGSGRFAFPAGVEVIVNRREVRFVHRKKDESCPGPD